MICTPCRTNEDIGEMPRYRSITFAGGTPLSLTVNVSTAFLDPRAVELGG